MADAPDALEPLNILNAHGLVEKKLTDTIETIKAHDLLFAECMNSETLPFLRQSLHYDAPNPALDTKVCNHLATELVPAYMEKKAKAEAFLHVDQPYEHRESFGSKPLVWDDKGKLVEQYKMWPERDQLIDALKPSFKEMQRLYHRLID
jgi:hypothetical protein